MIAQVPEVFETLTGVKVSDLMSRVPGFDGLVPSTAQVWQVTGPRTP
jgi:hypothetical protein